MITESLADGQPPPGRWSTALFGFKVSLLRARRAVADLRSPVGRHPFGALSDYPHVVAEHRSKLWTQSGASERRLELGKVQNLRVAVRRLNKAEVSSGTVFSFWAQLGRASRLQGYVPGRQLQEGCVVPAIGGGLCQLSNALYAVALEGCCEIVERHPHTRIVAGSAAALDKDATVAWNYVDLRFRARQPFLVEALLTSDELVVRLRTAQPRSAATGLISLRAKPRQRAAADSCETCGVDDCFRHDHVDRSDLASRSAFLVDECWPEFSDYVRATRTDVDLLAVPIDGARWKRPRYAWPMDGFADVRTATIDTLARSWRMRKLAAQGPVRRKAELAGAEAIAQAAAEALSFDTGRLCVAQSLLPFLWRDGHLGGRRFEVLATRLPMGVLQARLDEALALHPDRVLLGDFRADPEPVRLEAEALAAAERIVTPRAEVASLFPEKALLLEWQLPRPPAWTHGHAVLFPGPTAARKGAYELREAAKALDLEVVLLGGELEGAGFWDGVRTRRLGVADAWDGIAAVVQPAVVEERPRALLRAVAAGVPIVATSACGIPSGAHVHIVPANDSASLEAILRAVLVGTLKAPADLSR